MIESELPSPTPRQYSSLNFSFLKTSYRIMTSFEHTNKEEENSVKGTAKWAVFSDRLIVIFTDESFFSP